MDDLLTDTERFSLGGDGEVEKLKSENERLRSKIAQLQSNDAVSINAGRANIEIPFEDLDMDQQIGGGGFSLVYRAMYKGTPVAVKRWFNPDCTDAVMQEFREEVLTLRDLRHPHVVQFIGACMRPPNLCIVLVRDFSRHLIIFILSIPLQILLLNDPPYQLIQPMGGVALR